MSNLSFRKKLVASLLDPNELKSQLSGEGNLSTSVPSMRRITSLQQKLASGSYMSYANRPKSASMRMEGYGVNTLSVPYDTEVLGEIKTPTTPIITPTRKTKTSNSTMNNNRRTLHTNTNNSTGGSSDLKKAYSDLLNAQIRSESRIEDLESELNVRQDSYIRREKELQLQVIGLKRKCGIKLNSEEMKILRGEDIKSRLGSSSSSSSSSSDINKKENNNDVDDDDEKNFMKSIQHSGLSMTQLRKMNHQIQELIDEVERESRAALLNAFSQDDESVNIFAQRLARVQDEFKSASIRKLHKSTGGGGGVGGVGGGGGGGGSGVGGVGGISANDQELVGWMERVASLQAELKRGAEEWERLSETNKRLTEENAVLRRRATSYAEESTLLMNRTVGLKAEKSSLSRVIEDEKGRRGLAERKNLELEKKLHRLLQQQQINRPNTAASKSSAGSSACATNSPGQTARSITTPTREGNPIIDIVDQQEGDDVNIGEAILAKRELERALKTKKEEVLRLRSILEVERSNLKGVRASYMEVVHQRSEMQSFLYQCMEDTRNDIERQLERERNESSSKRKASVSSSSTSASAYLSNTRERKISLSDFSKKDRDAVLERLLSKDRILRLLRDQLQSEWSSKSSKDQLLHSKRAMANSLIPTMTIKEAEKEKEEEEEEEEATTAGVVVEEEEKEEGVAEEEEM